MGTELTQRERFELMKKSMLEDKSNASNPFMQLKAPDKIGEYNEYVVRLLPQKDGTISIFSEYYRHFYKSKITGKWVEVYCPATKGQPCPICEMCRNLWDSEQESNHKLASYYGKRKNWMIALFVKSDPTKPENNGTVQVLRYGKQIQDKIEDGIFNKAIDFAAQDISDQGIDFLIKAQKQKGSAGRSVNYNLSEFDRERTPMCDGDAEQAYADLCPDTLTTFQPNVKTYGEVKKVMQETITGVTDDDEIAETPGEESDEIPMTFPEKKAVAPAPKPKVAPAPKPAPKPSAKIPVVEEEVTEEEPVEDEELTEEAAEEAAEEQTPVEAAMEKAEVKVEVKTPAPKAAAKTETISAGDDEQLMDELASLRAELDAD